jgi:diguanylate cyclase (GGDEF)-like protein/PAS domain S-box-containing protein
LAQNHAAGAFYGYSREKLKSMRIDEISPSFHEEIKRRHLANLDREQYYVYPHRLSSGELRMVDVYSSPIHVGDQAYCYMIIVDVTAREKYKEELSNKKELLSLTLESIGDGVVTTDTDGRITSMNRAAQKITGWEERESWNLHFNDVFKLQNEETGKPVENPIAKALQTGSVTEMSGHTVLINKQGAAVPVADSAAPIKDERGNTFGAVMVFRDVTREREQQRQIRYMSYHDELTGLYNRRFAIEEAKRLNKDRQLPLAVIIGDVNGLKITNDAFGHAVGDKLLKKVAAALKASCREEDVIARWGGDEFLVLLPNACAQTARNVVQRMKKSFSQRSRGLMQVSVSLGYAVKEAPDEKMVEVLKEAERWMYRNKLLDAKSYRSTILNTLLATLYENSVETEEHSKRLQNCCFAIGKKLKLSNEELSELSLLAALHDIGKIGIHHQILQKPGRLTPKEWEEIRRHPEIGYRITKNIPELSIVAEYILLHHERWDGSGYPKGLKGEEIPLLCRILAVVDAFDVMTHGRVYRAACDTESAIAELKKNAGTQFDPKIVDLFIKTCK